MLLTHVEQSRGGIEYFRVASFSASAAISGRQMTGIIGQRHRRVMLTRAGLRVDEK